MSDPALSFSDGPPNNIPLDPTFLLYRFEAEGWPTERGVEVARDRHEEYKRIERVRILPWRFRHTRNGSPYGITHHATWLFEVVRKDEPYVFYYLPLYGTMPHEQQMIAILKDAFRDQAWVKLTWRQSYFFGERYMIEDVKIRLA